MLKALTYSSPALATLHEDYAKKHRVDERAPYLARATTTIEAPVATVWNRLCDVRSWAENLEPGVRDIDVPDGVVTDAWFWRRAGGIRMSARFAVVEPRRELAWTGRALGLRVVHRFTLEAVTGTRTTVEAEESMAGSPMAVLFSQAKLQALVEGSLGTLRAACEETHPGSRHRA